MARLHVFLTIQAATFVMAALVHFGVLIDGYGHLQAGIAESVIGIVLLTALIASSIRHARVRSAAIAAQAFAVVGTLAGIIAIAVGVGPQTIPDVIYHLAIIGVLVWGLFTAIRAHPDTGN